MTSLINTLNVFLLFIFFVGEAPSYASGRIDQVSGLKGFHRAGQTFLLWNGIEKYASGAADQQGTGGILQAQFKKRLAGHKEREKKGREIVYRVYRSSRPIQSDSLEKAQLVAEVRPLSAYYPYHLGMYWDQKRFRGKVIPRLAVMPERPVADGQELYVTML